MIAKVLGYQGIPTTRTVREHAASLALDLWLPWEDDRDSEWSFEHIPPERRRERTVVNQVYVAPQMLPCPELGCWEGSACVQTAPDDYDIVGVCERCNGLSVVAPPWPDYIATWQCRYAEMEPTDRVPWVNRSPDECAWEGHPWHERRQVVAYKVTATETLPVVDITDCRLGWRPHVCLTDGPVMVIAPHESRELVEPWAASLTPGQVVWRLHLEALDQPYTHVVERFISDDPDDDEERWDTAPLSVPVGEVAEIELVDPKENTDG